MAGELRWGQDWVQGEFERVATDLGIQAKVVGWHQSSEDFDRGAWSFRFDLAGNSCLIEFSEEELEDAHGTSGLTMELAARIAAVVGGLLRDLSSSARTPQGM